MNILIGVLEATQAALNIIGDVLSITFYAVIAWSVLAVAMAVVFGREIDRTYGRPAPWAISMWLWLTWPLQAVRFASQRRAAR